MQKAFRVGGMLRLKFSVRRQRPTPHPDHYMIRPPREGEVRDSKQKGGPMDRLLEIQNLVKA